MPARPRRRNQPFSAVLFEGGVMVGGAIGLMNAATYAMHHPAPSHPCPTGHQVGAALGQALGNCIGKATTSALSPYVREGLTGAMVGGAIALGIVLLWRLVMIRVVRTRSKLALARARPLGLAVAGPSSSVAPPTRRHREPIPEHVRHEVWRRDEGCCVDCGSRERLEFDHIIPLSRGGSNTTRNIELRCESCNRRKGSRI